LSWRSGIQLKKTREDKSTRTIRCIILEIEDGRLTDLREEFRSQRYLIHEVVRHGSKGNCIVTLPVYGSDRRGDVESRLRHKLVDACLIPAPDHREVCRTVTPVQCSMIPVAKESEVCAQIAHQEDSMSNFAARVSTLKTGRVD
jgi:hypothetical protein